MPLIYFENEPRWRDGLARAEMSGNAIYALKTLGIIDDPCGQPTSNYDPLTTQLAAGYAEKIIDLLAADKARRRANAKI